MEDNPISTGCAGQPADCRYGRQSIYIAIDTKGNINLETIGTSGKQCDTIAGALEATLGDVICRANKETYFDE